MFFSHVILIYLTVVKLAYGQSIPKDFDQKKALEVENCFYNITCTAREAIALKRIFDKCIEENLGDKCKKWLDSNFNLNTENTVKFWVEDFTNKMCLMEFDDWKKRYRQMMMEFGNFIANVCAKGRKRNEETCKHVNALQDTGYAMFDEYVEKKVCKLIEETEYKTKFI